MGGLCVPPSFKKRKMYKCTDFFKSINGKNYSKGMLITFEEYYRIGEDERKYFVFQQDQNVVKKYEDRIK